MNNEHCKFQQNQQLTQSTTEAQCCNTVELSYTVIQLYRIQFVYVHYTNKAIPSQSRFRIKYY